MFAAFAFAMAFIYSLMKEPPETEPENTKKRAAPRALKRSSDIDSNSDDDSHNDSDSTEYVSDDEEEYTTSKKQKTSTTKSKQRPDVWMELWINADTNTSICDVPGDGNCLFSATALSKLTLDNKTAKKKKFFDTNSLKRAAARLRKCTINYMKDNADDVKPFIHDDTLEDHLKKMEKSSCWPDDIHVKVLTEVLEQPIFVYRQGHNCITVQHKHGEQYITIDNSGDNVIRIFYEPEHYQAIAQK
jgi:hypothetical protein